MERCCELKCCTRLFLFLPVCLCPMEFLSSGVSNYRLAGWVLPECVERADHEEETCWMGWDANACSNTWGVMEDTSIYECINVHTVSHTLYVSFIILRNIGMNYAILYITYFNWFENICWILIYGCVILFIRYQNYCRGKCVKQGGRLLFSNKNL